MSTPKRKSQLRFEQLNRIADVIAQTLPTSTHVAVLMIAYRHAGPGGQFSVSTNRIADACRISDRWAKNVIDDLERLGVIVMLQDHKGPIPRRYKITGRAAANGEVGFTNKDNPPPRSNGEVGCS